MENDCEILGISEKSNIKEIKEQYKLLIKKHHPDKGGDHNNFIKITNAYHNLVKRKSSNQYENIIKDLYNEGIIEKYINLFYNKFIFQHSNNDKIIKIDYTLEELYNGCIKTIKYKRKVAISATEFINEEKILNLNIDNTRYNNEKIIYEKYGNGFNFGKEYGNLIIILNEIEHSIFKRQNYNLITDINLTLKEALIPGTIIKIPLLNNEYYDHVITKSIDIFDSDIIKNKGLKYDNKIGDLIIKYNISLPKNLNKEQEKLIKNLF
jgi:DnaJ-class molecular chaperone